MGAWLSRNCGQMEPYNEQWRQPWRPDDAQEALLEITHDLILRTAELERAVRTDAPLSDQLALVTQLRADLYDMNIVITHGEFMDG